MFVSGLESLRDNLTWYYLVALLISVLAIILAFVFSLKNTSATIIYEKKRDDTISSDGMPIEEIQTENSEEIEDDVSRNVKTSSALRAEMVIKANMTEEQKSLEQEVRKKQLAEIFKLMQQETDKFGEISMTEVEEQMKLYQ